MMTFHGLLPVDSFEKFAQHRAARLSLKLKIMSQNVEQACFAIQGPAVLIDAFEMAMSLGPAECHVGTIDRRPFIASDKHFIETDETFTQCVT